MNKKYLIGGVIALVAIIVIALIAFGSKETKAPTTETQTPQATSTVATSTNTATDTTGIQVDIQTSGPKTYTMAQVATHKGASSCWTVIEGKVYNLTAWISQHPGGEQAILSICGIDGTAAFTAQHDHAQRQQDILATFYIGNLK